MTALDDLRSLYLDFYSERGHAVIPSSPLVPENDPTTLFTSSGMQPLVPHLLGQPHAQGKRLVDSQRCFRSQDIEEVGDNRHTTFFEMLGNWSLGDYFKKEQLGWIFEFLTTKVGLPVERLAVSVFEGNDQVSKDNESIKIWKSLGVKKDRIFTYGTGKNWWSRSGTPDKMPPGEPGGPDSEVFFEFTKVKHDPKFGKVCHPNCDCGRFLEIGNSVFMQYKKTADGLIELAQKNVDFGGGLERIMAAKHNDPDVFLNPGFLPIINKLETISGKQYGSQAEVTRSFRVIADHIKAAVMLAADGVFPGNKAQGYFSRRLIRRSVRYGKMMGIERPFVSDLVEPIILLYKKAYPHVATKAGEITQVLVTEENKFLHTLDKGLKEIAKLPNLDGENAFMLYETYGFPLELTQEIAQERGQVVERDVFSQEFAKHKEQSRTASVGMFKGGLADHGEITTKYHTATHLLQAALRKILGESVQQKGSNITSERMRFDFTHPEALTPYQIKQVETQINDWITDDLPVTVEIMQKQEALSSGAIAFFVEKYPDIVTVYSVGDPRKRISKELCGGPHVKHTGTIGKVKITKEQAVASGIRRIYLVLDSTA